MMCSRMLRHDARHGRLYGFVEGLLQGFLLGAPAAGSLWEQARRSIKAALELPQRIDPATREKLEVLLQRPSGSSTAWSPGAALAELSPLGDPAARPTPSLASVEAIDTLEVRNALMTALEACASGSEVCAASAWFSDIELLEGFHRAALRGARVRLLVDDLSGLALGPVSAWFVHHLANLRVIERAHGMAGSGLEIRVHCSAAGRMMHLKSAGFSGEPPWVIGGQANYTPNSFSGAWLETVVRVEGGDVYEQFCAQFETLWGMSEVPKEPRWWLRAGRRALLETVEKTVFRF
jgi:hypothetical protein